MTMRSPLLLQALVGGIISIALVGCGGGGGGGGTVSTQPKIRVINASSDSNPIRVDLDDTTLNPAVPYLDSTTTFLQKKPATYDVQLFDSVTGESLWAETTTVANNTKYLVVAYGIENDTPASTGFPHTGTEPIKRIRTSEFSVDLTAPVGSKATLIVFHGFNRGPGLDTPSIDFKNPGENPQYDLPGIGYGTNQSITVDSGSAQSFEVRQNGTENVFVTSTPTLAAGGVYLVVVSGVEGAAAPQDPKITYIKLN